MSSIITVDVLARGICKTEQRTQEQNAMICKFLRQDGSVIFRDVPLADRSQTLQASTTYHIVHYENNKRKEVFSKLDDNEVHQAMTCILLNLPKIGIKIPPTTVVYTQVNNDSYQRMYLTSFVESYVRSVALTKSMALQASNNLIALNIRGVESFYATNNGIVLFPGYSRLLKLSYDALSSNSDILNLQKMLVLDTLDNFVLFNYFRVKDLEKIVVISSDSDSTSYELPEVIV